MAYNKRYWTPKFPKIYPDPLMHVGEIWRRVFTRRVDSNGYRYFNDESGWTLYAEHTIPPRKEPLVTGHLYYHEDFVVLDTYKGEFFWVRILVSGSGFVGWMKVYAATWEEDFELVWC